MVKRILKHTRGQRLAFNMLWCALLLWPWKPLLRETISGFIGRKAATTGKPVWRRLAHFIDWMHPGEPDHCAVTWRYEESGRRAIYPEQYQ